MTESEEQKLDLLLEVLGRIANALEAKVDHDISGKPSVAYMQANPGQFLNKF